jgi:hypothetical protein
MPLAQRLSFPSGQTTQRMIYELLLAEDRILEWGMLHVDILKTLKKTAYDTMLPGA